MAARPAVTRWRKLGGDPVADSRWRLSGNGPRTTLSGQASASRGSQAVWLGGRTTLL